MTDQSKDILTMAETHLQIACTETAEIEWEGREDVIHTAGNATRNIAAAEAYLIAAGILDGADHPHARVFALQVIGDAGIAAERVLRGDWKPETLARATGDALQRIKDHLAD